MGCVFFFSLLFLQLLEEPSAATERCVSALIQCIFIIISTIPAVCMSADTKMKRIPKMFFLDDDVFYYHYGFYYN